VDAAILAAAHREAGARPRSLGSTLRQWRVPLGVAAVIVLSVSVVTLMREEGGEDLLRQAPPLPAAPPAERSAGPATQPVPPEAGKPARPVAAAPGPPAPAAIKEAEAPAAPAKVEDSARGDAASAMARGAASGPATGSAASPPAQPFPAAPRMAEDRRDIASPGGNLAGARVPDHSAAAELGAAQKAGAPAAEPERVKSAPRAAQATYQGGDRLPPWHGFEKEPPEKWLARILELKRQDRAAEAADMLAEFRRRFPAHPLPPALQYAYEPPGPDSSRRGSEAAAPAGAGPGGMLSTGM